MAPKYFTGIPSIQANSETSCLVETTCNLEVTLAPEVIYGNVDYYKDPNQNVGGSGFKSRYYDFMERHNHPQCTHHVPDYYANYGDKFVRLMTKELFPQLSEIGQKWLLKARRLLQQYMEKGFQQNQTSTHIFMQYSSNIYQKTHSSSSYLVVMVNTPEGTETLELDSDNFKKFAFQTHPLAYVEGGFHEMETSDYGIIIKFFAEDAWHDWRLTGKLPDREMGRQIVTIMKDMLANHKMEYLKKGVHSAEYIGQTMLNNSVPNEGAVYPRF